MLIPFLLKERNEKINIVKKEIGGDRFMKNIILITGASYTGKTVLAQKILEKYGYPYLSIDHLKMGLIRSGNTKLKADDDDELTEYLWPIIAEMIKTVIENNQKLVVEGGYIPLDWDKYFDSDYLKHIKYFCLAMSDLYIDNNFDVIVWHSNDIERRLEHSSLIKDRLKRDNNFFMNNNRECSIIN